MLELLISESDAVSSDAVDKLWQLVPQALLEIDVRAELEAVDAAGSSELETHVCLAVRGHLIAANGIALGEVLTEHALAAPLSRWDAVLTDLQSMTASLTPRSNNFHMKLASKYADYYRSFETKALADWVAASRAKSHFLEACSLANAGNPTRAYLLAGELAATWRSSLSARLPGLKEIENAASKWAASVGHSKQSAELASSANVLRGRFQPYAEDGPEDWSSPRTPEGLVRFGSSAAVLPRT